MAKINTMELASEMLDCAEDVLDIAKTLINDAGASLDAVSCEDPQVDAVIQRYRCTNNVIDTLTDAVQTIQRAAKLLFALEPLKD